MGRNIAHIVWDEKGTFMEVGYAEGEPHRVTANHLVAVTLAKDSDLVSVPAPPGVLRWVRSA